MKVGKLDITIPALVYLAILLVVVVVDYRMFQAQAFSRLEGRLEPTIRMALMDGSAQALDEGVIACHSLLEADPAHPAALLQLATIRYRQGKYADAQEAFEKAAKSSRASEREKALAQVGAGASLFAQAEPQDRPAAAAKAAEFFKAGLEAKKDEPNAKAALAIAQLWLGKDQEASKALQEVLESKTPPGLKGTACAYNALGVALSRTGLAGKADRSFQSALAIVPDWKVIEDNRRITAIASMASPDMELEARERLIEQYEGKTRDFGARECLALNAVGVGLYLTRPFKSDKAYAEAVFPRAMKALKQARKQFPADTATYWNLVGINEQRLFGDAAGKGGLLAELPAFLFERDLPGPARTNPWLKGNYRLPEPALTTDQTRVLAETEKACKELLEILDRLRKIPKLALKDDTEAMLRQLRIQCLLWSIELLDSNRKAQAHLINELGESVIRQAPDDPRGYRVWGLALYRQESYKRAYELLEQAVAKGAPSESLKPMLESMKRPISVFDPRPRAQGWRGGVAMGSLSARAPSSWGSLSASATVDGAKAAVTLAGTQALILLDPNILTHGDHRIEFAFTDATGATAAQALNFSVDLAPPTLELDPPQTADGPRPVWTVKLTDTGAGVSLKSVNVEFKNVSPSATPCNDVLVRRGVYNHDFANIEVRNGQALSAATFKVSSARELKAGVYKFIFTFADMKGNAGKKEIQVIVKS